MDSFQSDVYNFIYSLFKNDVVREKAKLMIDAMDGFSEEYASGPPRYYHHGYEGGLADHTALVVLDAYHSVLSKPWLNVNVDDMLIVTLAHDLDKIGKYHPEYHRVAYGDRETVQTVERFGLRNNTVQDGIFLIHGGWSNVKNVEHGQLEIYAHAADMLGSHATKKEEETRDMIVHIMREILKISCIGKKSNGECLHCGSKMIVDNNSHYHPEFATRYRCLKCSSSFVISGNTVIEVDV